MITKEIAAKAVMLLHGATHNLNGSGIAVYNEVVGALATFAQSVDEPARESAMTEGASEPG